MSEPYPSYITAHSDISGPRLGNVWRSKSGAPCAAVYLGDADITFRSSADADAVIAAVTGARDALRAMEAEHVRAEPGTGVDL